MNAIKQPPNSSVSNQVLSLVALDHSKKTLTDPINGLTFSEVETAQQYARIFGPGNTKPSAPTPRNRIDMTKVQHFIAFQTKPECI